MYQHISYIIIFIFGYTSKEEVKITDDDYLKAKKYFEEEEKKTLELVGTIVLGKPAHEPPKAERKRNFRVRKLDS